MILETIENLKFINYLFNYKNIYNNLIMLKKWIEHVKKYKR